MPRLTLRVPDTYTATAALVNSFEDAIAKAFSDVTVDQIGTFVKFYDVRFSRPCEPISATLTALDRPGRREKLQDIVDSVLKENPEIQRYKTRHEKLIDLDADWRQKEDWVAA